MTEGLWYIDAIDARGGLAVASQRQGDLMSGSMKETGPIAFIAPPSFAPEFVASRSPGFALARGQGQLGLFVDGREVPFDSLAAVAEFVRRAYLRGAGGDGPGGGAPVEGGPTPRPLEGPEGEGLRPMPEGGLEKEVDPVAQLKAMATQFRPQSWEKPLSFERGESRQAEGLELSRFEPFEGRTAARRIVRGALLLMHELCARRPGAGDWHRTTSLDWYQAAEMVVAMVYRMGLEPWIREQFKGEEALRRWFFILPDQRPLPHPGGSVSRLIFWDTPIYYRWLEDHRWPYFWPARRQSDAFEALGRLTVPAYLRTNDADAPTVQALLSAASAAPAESFLGSSRIEAEERAEIVLFAAAFLNLREDEGAPLAEILPEIFLADLAQRALTWLAANLPKRIFAPEVETLIESASTVPA